MKVLYVKHEYLLEIAGYLKRTKESKIDGVLCYNTEGESVVLINKCYCGKPLEIAYLIFHEIVHYILDKTTKTETLHNLLDYLSYEWRIKDGKYRW